MKKFYLVLSILFTISFYSAKAQVYSHGDVTVTLMPGGSHDTNTCSSTGQLFYSININNSFIGDSVIIKDMSNGAIVYAAANSTGQNPWSLMQPVFNAFGFASDDMISGNYAYFGGTINKVISGPDTVLNILNTYQVYVPNPCQYANVTGKVYVDYNTDCAYNGIDVPLVGVGVSVAESLNSPSMTSIGYGTSTDGSGNYTVHALKSWFTGATVSIPSNYQFIFPSTTCSPAFYSLASVPQANVDFSLQCSSLIDVQCWAGSAGTVRPNQPFMLYPYVSNTGCDLASGVLKLVLDPNVVYAAGLSTNPATTVVGDTLMWNYVNLTSLSSGAYWNSFMSGIYLTPTAAVNIGDNLCFRVFTNIPANDVDGGNNDYTICLPVVNSFDPNFKEVYPKGVGATGDIPLATSKLTYTIHFQNTGSAPAINVSIVDSLDSDIALNSVQILGTSHTMAAQWLAPGVVKFNFNNIYLPDSNSNEPASHGYVRFNVRLKPGLALGTKILNKARIYFDSNPAIVTNTVTNTLANIVGINENTSTNNMVSVYPNPATDVANFVLGSENLPDTYSFILTDMLGHVVKSMDALSGNQFSVSRSGLAGGVYFYKVYSDKGVLGNGKLVIE
ncbi:MAG: T9SS type A sorting domain-containing protein [Bacteroidota bacterium]